MTYCFVIFAGVAFKTATMLVIAITVVSHVLLFAGGRNLWYCRHIGWVKLTPPDLTGWFPQYLQHLLQSSCSPKAGTPLCAVGSWELGGCSLAPLWTLNCCANTEVYPLSTCCFFHSSFSHYIHYAFSQHPAPFSLQHSQCYIHFLFPCSTKAVRPFSWDNARCVVLLLCRRDIKSLSLLA